MIMFKEETGASRDWLVLKFKIVTRVDTRDSLFGKSNLTTKAYLSGSIHFLHKVSRCCWAVHKRIMPWWTKVWLSLSRGDSVWYDQVSKTQQGTTMNILICGSTQCFRDYKEILRDENLKKILVWRDVQLPFSQRW